LGGEWIGSADGEGAIMRRLKVLGRRHRCSPPEVAGAPLVWVVPKHGEELTREEILEFLQNKAR
jgi:hypothetical protein